MNESTNGVRVVLAAHGSRSAEANAAIVALAAELSALLDRAIDPAFLEMAEPTIPQAISRALERGAERIVLVPYFLTPGMHVRRDIVAIVEGERAKTRTPIEVAPFFGTDPEIPSIIARIIEDACEHSVLDRKL